MNVTDSDNNLFAKALKRPGPIFLDGGLATELEARGYDISKDLWSAGLLRSDPQAIIDVHRAYLDAGAQCIISASYQASRQGFMSLGISANDADELIASSVLLARTARQQYLDDNPGTDPLPIVAASIGPYGATLHDGSEYTGNYGVSRDAIRRFHEERLSILDRAGADVLACETIPDYQEARVLCELLENAESPAWISFSCRDDRHISDGTPLEQAARLFRKHPRVLAIGINCTAPRLISSLIDLVKAAAPDKAIVVYPNSGEKYDAEKHSWSGTINPVECAVAARAWRDAGAKLIGGCCRMGPQHIAAMNEHLSEGGPR
ncbi:MAG: homocysteine S-methyltransferase [Gammaproteobacteria bacterium]|nr:MAG: homocysteine S-methyltransferase [Gammaproteobacteria bacterium]